MVCYPPRGRKKFQENTDGNSWLDESSSEENDSSSEKIENRDKSKTYFVSDHTRRYPEDSALTGFPVFIESADQAKPIGTRDIIQLSSHIKRFNKGIKYLQSINKYKIGVHFENPTLANTFLCNQTFMKEYRFKVSIPDLR